MAFFKSPVPVNGVMIQKETIRETDKVKEMPLDHSVTLDRLGEFVFRRPLVVRVSYPDNDGHWCLENSDLSLSGDGSTYPEALASLAESLESLITGYRAFEDAVLSGKSRKIKKDLQNYLDF